MIQRIALLAILTCLTSIVLSQSNRYISTTGSNSNNGSLAAPWRTLQYGINQASANDTLNMLSGSYNEKVVVSQSNIYIRNYNAQRPVISGAGITAQDAIIQISNRSNITIDGLEIANSIQLDAQGILVDGNCDNVSIKNCVIHDIHFSANANDPVNSNKNAQGIIVYGTNATIPIKHLKITANTLYNCRLGYSEGIAVNGNVDSFEITNNAVHDITNIGIDAIGHEGTCPNAANDQARNGLIKNNTTYRCLSPYATSGGLYVDGGKNIVVENNVSYHNGYGIEIGCENIGKTTDNIIVRNNILYDNEICALAFGGYDYPSGSGKVTNSVFTNNTCYKNDFTNSGTGELYISYSENSVIENNTFYVSPQNILAYARLGQPLLRFNYNIAFCDAAADIIQTDWNNIQYNTLAVFKTGSLTNINSLFANPLFINAGIANPDFHISATSAAKDAGNPSFIAGLTERDIDNELRVNTIVDCGADEYYSTQTIYTFTGSGNWTDVANWAGNNKPPATITGTAKIIIDPSGNGECILNTAQHVNSNAQIIIQLNKKLRVLGNLSITN